MPFPEQLRGKLRAGEIKSETIFREASEHYLREFDIITQKQRNKRYVEGQHWPPEDKRRKKEKKTKKEWVPTLVALCATGRGFDVPEKPGTDATFPVTSLNRNPERSAERHTPHSFVRN